MFPRIKVTDVPVQKLQVGVKMTGGQKNTWEIA